MVWVRSGHEIRQEVPNIVLDLLSIVSPCVTIESKAPTTSASDISKSPDAHASTEASNYVCATSREHPLDNRFCANEPDSLNSTVAELGIDTSPMVKLDRDIASAVVHDPKNTA